MPVTIFRHLCSLLLAAPFCLALNACQPAADKASALPAKATQPPHAATVKVPAPDTDFACAYFYFLWGRNAELRLQFAEALEAYEKAVICDPEASYAEDKIPILLLRLERSSEAASWLERYLQKNPGNATMRMLYARVLLGQHNTAAAMEQYQRIVENHPDDPTVMLPLAEVYLVSGHTDNARTILSKILQLDPQSYQAHILMARLLRGEDRPEEAKAHYSQALGLNWSAEVQSEEAELLVQQKDYVQAEAMYRDIIDREEQNENAYLGLIRLFLLQGRDDLALQELQNLRQVADKPLWVDLSIARLYIKQKKYKAARSVLEQMLNRENITEARYLLAILLQQEKKYEAALRQVRLIDHKAPEFLDALGLMVNLYKELNRADDAVLLLERNIANPITRHPVMYRLLASLHDSQGRSTMGRRVLEQGIAHFPGDEDLLYSYGLLLEGQGEHTAALEVMENIVAINPKNAAALNFVGYSWAEKSINLDKALDYLLQAVTLKPDNGYIRDSLGWVLYKLGRVEEATHELEEASRLAQDDPAILEHLAEVYLAAGKREAALTLYKQLLKHYIDSQNETARHKTLEQIYSIEHQPSP
ncbi:MAG: tetratricopeptide repeat protein [Desulfobulbus sp.]|jgi:tetratricopeptide (TPR) repeat protein